MYLIMGSSKLVFAPLRRANADTIRARLDCSRVLAMLLEHGTIPLILAFPKRRRADAR
jgi:hypothetical protein